MRTIHRFIPSLLFGCLVWLAMAQPARADHVRFYVDGLPPYAKLNGDGPPTGFAVDLMGRMMMAAGEHFAPSDIKVMNWARAVREVEIVPGTALLVLAKLPERVDRYKWVCPLDTLPMGIFVRRDSGIVIERLEDLRRYRVGMVRNTAPLRVLAGLLPRIEPDLVLLSGIPAQLRMLREGRVDVIIQAVEATRQLMDEEGMNPDDYAMFELIEPLQICFGFNKFTDDGLINRLQRALDELMEVDSSGSSPYERMRESYRETKKFHE